MTARGSSRAGGTVLALPIGPGPRRLYLVSAYIARMLLAPPRSLFEPGVPHSGGPPRTPRPEP